MAMYREVPAESCEARKRETGWCPGRSKIDPGKWLEILCTLSDGNSPEQLSVV
jgi:hypothetical protein